MTGPDPMTDLLRLIGEAPQEALPTILTALTARMLEMGSSTPQSASPADPRGDERLVGADEVARLLSVSRRQVFSLSRRADWRPFVVRAGRKMLRFRERQLLRWLSRQTGTGH